jgi:large subunit ribosomal protein L3
MIAGLIGRKAGMTQVFAENGAAVPVTVLVAGPCVVLEVKTSEKHGYEAAQLGLLEKKRITVNKPREGHAKKHGAPPVRIVREFSYDTKPEPGEKVTVEIFKGMKYVDVSGTTKGRGFTGVVKRWGFKGGPKSHGSMFHRAPGSIGASSFPSRVWKGMKMGGRYGNERVTVQNLEVIKVDPEKNLLLVRGAVPGHRKGYVLINRAVKKHA